MKEIKMVDGFARADAKGVHLAINHWSDGYRLVIFRTRSKKVLNRKKLDTINRHLEVCEYGIKFVEVET